MFNFSTLHHVLTADEEVELLNIFEENSEAIDGIEYGIAALNDPKFDSSVWNDSREKLEVIRTQLLEANYKCQILLVTLGLYDAIFIRKKNTHYSEGTHHSL